MFKFKKVNESLVSIVDGKMISITEVPDEVFSEKILGDGVAFIVQDRTIVSPCSGELTTVFPGGHAYGITRSDGVEVLIHIGIDTVQLDGKGFYSKVKQGDKVAVGETLVEIDLPFLKTTGLDLSVMLVVLNSNGKEIQFCEYGEVQKGESTIMKIVSK
ncbi:PTS glucose transporter subunit IIA [Enterococcus hulanensis]|uniref:PTS sugar transporter subunit IIA n=1 Tax=Enterococcus hulanensis TaxID=2559929 RepID=UPI001A8F81AE|nr:PTS glucose transporter subunit IIA [Enterococcus hulanensis]MBO0458116.1 PTS glucose transporter subunit IIA [Enterococcus hulanensis]